MSINQLSVSSSPTSIVGLLYGTYGGKQFHLNHSCCMSGYSYAPSSTSNSNYCAALTTSCTGAGGVRRVPGLGRASAPGLQQRRQRRRRHAAIAEALLLRGPESSNRLTCTFRNSWEPDNGLAPKQHQQKHSLDTAARQPLPSLDRFRQAEQLDAADCPDNAEPIACAVKPLFGRQVTPHPFLLGE